MDYADEKAIKTKFGIIKFNNVRILKQTKNYLHTISRLKAGQRNNSVTMTQPHSGYGFSSILRSEKKCGSHKFLSNDKRDSLSKTQNNLSAYSEIFFKETLGKRLSENRQVHEILKTKKISESVGPQNSALIVVESLFKKSKPVEPSPNPIFAKQKNYSKMLESGNKRKLILKHSPSHHVNSEIKIVENNPYDANNLSKPILVKTLNRNNADYVEQILTNKKKSQRKVIFRKIKIKHAKSAQPELCNNSDLDSVLTLEKPKRKIIKLPIFEISHNEKSIQVGDNSPSKLSSSFENTQKTFESGESDNENSALSPYTCDFKVSVKKKKKSKLIFSRFIPHRPSFDLNTNFNN